MEITDERMKMSTETENLGEITVLYKLVAGASDRRFGLNVALLSQVSHMMLYISLPFVLQFEFTLSEQRVYFVLKHTEVNH